MIHWFHVLLIMLMESFSARRDAQLRFLKCQIEILQQRLPGNRIVIDPTERQRLLTMGKELEHQVQETLLVVSLKTYKNWLLEERRGKKPKTVGRKRISSELYNLVVRFAKENATWGLGRILGEVRKLGENLGRTSIQRILKKEGLYPDPYRKAHQVPDSPWRKFIDMHLNTLVACDFLTKEVVTPLGKKTAFLLMFIHLESRKVFVSPATYEPNEQWVCQQARNVGMWLDEHEIHQRFILHDRDTKFPKSFDAVFKARGVTAIRTPYRSPNANAYAESWIGNCKRECLNHPYCFSLVHLDYIAQAFVTYYNRHRPHQSKGNTTLRFPTDPKPLNPISTGEVKCQATLGGLLRHYYRKAA